MPKTPTMNRDTRIRSAHSPDRAPDRGAQRMAILLFLLAYIAILGVLFAPKGYFLAEPEVIVLAE